MTSIKIMDSVSPILYVSHEEDDGMWQFLDGGEVSEEDARILGLKEVIDIDPSLVQLANLPIGWIAWRETEHCQWIRTRAKR
ncbi:hypothetical protein SY83_09905 [Paenibacillus swuensis]|uniref:DUF2185 domain-containing protein n=1 Tax=Paenibacillus swuensis TaxID=1178515 RepID=A0A172THM4_9BACL|nr:hypothetical protein SY83_09905 [Paenibacillus swuensis]